MANSPSAAGRIAAMMRARGKSAATVPSNVKAAARKSPSTGTSAYSAGNTVYGGGRPMPTVGPVDKSGYRERDANNRNKRAAMLRRLKANQSGNYNSPDSLRK